MVSAQKIDENLTEKGGKRAKPRFIVKYFTVFSGFARFSSPAMSCNVLLRFLITKALSLNI